MHALAFILLAFIFGTSTFAAPHVRGSIHKHKDQQRDLVEVSVNKEELFINYSHLTTTIPSPVSTAQETSSSIQSASLTSQSSPISSSTAGQTAYTLAASSSSSSALPVSSTSSISPAPLPSYTSTSVAPAVSTSTSLVSSSAYSTSAPTSTESSSSSSPSTTQSVSTASATTAASATSSSLPSASPSAVNTGGKYPFLHVVAFGDNLSDNGNGSCAHGVAQQGDPSNTIYGFGTWTNGPIAVSYLVDELGVPMNSDYAYGHADGGSKFGATIDNAYTQSTANAPSAIDQIANYTSHGAPNIKESLQFLWIGANDINLYHINVDSTDNSAFASAMASKMAALVKSLLDAGAPYVFVANLYPKHVSPSSEFYCSNDTTKIANLGSAIAQANAAVKSSLSTFGTQAIYYDTYSFMLGIWNSPGYYGITHEGGEFCDGYSQQDWDLCVTYHQGNTFYWMQYLDMTTYVHSLVAEDMKKTIDQHFGV